MTCQSNRIDVRSLAGIKYKAWSIFVITCLSLLARLTLMGAFVEQETPKLAILARPALMGAFVERERHKFKVKGVLNDVGMHVDELIYIAIIVVVPFGGSLFGTRTALLQ